MPEFAECDMRYTSIHLTANQKTEEDLEVETYMYEDSRPERVEDQRILVKNNCGDAVSRRKIQ